MTSWKGGKEGGAENASHGQFHGYGGGDALRWEEAGGRGAAVRGRAVQVRSEAQKDTQLETDAGKGPRHSPPVGLVSIKVWQRSSYRPKKV